MSGYDNRKHFCWGPHPPRAPAAASPPTASRVVNFKSIRPGGERPVHGTLLLMPITGPNLAKLP